MFPVAARLISRGSPPFFCYMLITYVCGEKKTNRRYFYCVPSFTQMSTMKTLKEVAFVSVRKIENRPIRSG